MENLKDLSNSVIFPKGDKATRDYFIGNVWVQMLVAEEFFNCSVYNVTFEPKARTKWHSHPGGQILLVTGGKGYYQEEEKPAQSLREGDIVKIQPNVKHWHGASKDRWFVHVGISTNPNLGDAEWYGSVSHEEYDKLEV
ncbi:MAG: cupin domain-containing protein [Promethearchaeota archaeon]